MEEQITSIIKINEKDKRKTKTLFFLYFGSLFAAFIPLTIASLFAAMICICVVATLYATKSNAEEDSLTENHMKFMIRTFWRANLYVLICAIFAVIFILVAADYSSLSPCIRALDNFLINAANTANLSKIQALAELCEKSFIKDNLKQMITAGVVALGPTLLYLIVQCLKGWNMIANDKIK